MTLDSNTITGPTCAAATATTSTEAALDTSPGVAQIPQCVEVVSDANTIPTILSSERLSPTSVKVSWGPYAGINSFNVRYGFENGAWLYNFDVEGFTATINSLPVNQPIWVSVASRNYCSIGVSSEGILIGGPRLPNTGYSQKKYDISWYVLGGIIIFFAQFLYRKIDI